MIHLVPGGFLKAVVEDTAPVLGGDLDAGGFKIGNVSEGDFDSLIVDTTSLVVQSVSHRIGMGTASPNYDVELTRDGVDMNFYVFSHSNDPSLKPNIVVARSRGTRASPTALVLNDRLGFFGFSGHDGTGYQAGASVEGFCDATPSAGAVPARISFLTGANFATRLERLKIGYQGAVTINEPTAGNTLNLNRKTGQSSIRAIGSTHLMLDSSDTEIVYLNYYVAGHVVMVVGGGKVGVGIASPTALLDVNSDILRLRTAKTPASAGAAGNAGDICWDASFVYVCVASSTWERAALSSW